MDQDFLKSVVYPVLVSGGSVLVVAVVTAVVRQVGNGAKLPKRVAALEAKQSADVEFKRTMLVVTGHQTAALQTLLEVTKGKRVNGNVDQALKRMDDAQKQTESYLVASATGSGGESPS